MLAFPEHVVSDAMTVRIINTRVLDNVELLDRDGKLRLLRACGVSVAIEGGIWSAKVDRCGIASPNQDDVIELAVALLKTRRDLWPSPPSPMDPAA